MRIAVIAAVLVVLAVAAGSAQDYTTTPELQKLVAEKTAPYILVDVRTPEEFSSGHIPTALNIPYEQIVEKAPTTDKGALIIVYCRSGSRSTAAADMLKKAGYNRVVNFGGISRWKGEIVKP
jgi:phage shock protein E